MRIILLAVASLLLLSNQLFGQDKIDSKLLQEEIEILVDIVIGISPKLSEEDRNQISKLIEQKKKTIEGKTMTNLEYFNFLAELDLPTQFDEHASIQIDEDVLTPLLERAKLFPIPIKILKDRVVVNGKSGMLPYASIIHSINGQVIDSVLRMTSSDPDNLSKRNMENQFFFDYCIKKPFTQSYSVAYSEPSAPEINLKKKIDGLDLSECVKELNEVRVYPLNRDSLKNFINTKCYPNHKAYYFQLNSFCWDENSNLGRFERFSNKKAKFDKCFKKIFKEVGKLGAENLIIDLRHNGGGEIHNPGLLYSYIAKNKFVQHAQLEIPDFLLPQEKYIIKLDDKECKGEEDIADFMNAYRSNFEKGESSFFSEAIKEQEMFPNKHAFRGNVYLLVGGYTCSASSYFTALFKGEKRGVIIGEQIGGSHHSITAGTNITYQMPHTGFKVKVPLMVVNFSDELYEKVPELKVNPDIELRGEKYYQYFLNKQDPELETVFQLIAEGD